MTIESTVTFTDWMLTNGVNKNWAYTMALRTASHVRVDVRDETTGEIVTYSSDLGYSPVDPNSGHIVYPVVAAALPTGFAIRIRRELPLEQPVEIGNEGAFNPEIHEEAFDAGVMVDQQLQAQIDRALKLPLGEEGLGGAGFVLPSPEANAVLTWDPSASGLINGPTTTQIISAEANAQTATDKAQEASETLEQIEIIVDGLTAQTVTFSTLADAQAYNPGAGGAPDSIQTRGRTVLGVGAGFYVANGTGAGDLVIASGDGYTLAQNPLNLATIANIVDDGGVADQTAVVVAALSALKAADYKGLITVPHRIKLKPGQLTPVMPPKAVFKAVIIMQPGADTGYLQMVDLTIDCPPNANSDTAILHLSGHYADFMTNVDGAAGTTSGDTGLQGVSHGYGMLKRGAGGPRVMLQQNWVKSPERSSEYSGEGIAAWLLRTRVPWRARNFEYWQSGMVVAIGDYILAANGRYYRATTAGTSTVSPTHTDGGTVSVGGVSWKDENGSWLNFSIALYVDELGRVGNRAVPAAMTQYWKQNPEDPEQYNVYYDAAGPAKTISFRYRPTNGVGDTLAGVPVMRAQNTPGSGRLQWIDSGFNNSFIEMDDANGLGLASIRRIQKTAPNNSTAPSVLGAGRLAISNSGATSITNFIQPTVGQEVELYFTNGNTTLVHSASLYLRGLTNVTPTNGGIIVITRDHANSGWVEKSRNF